MTYHIEPIPRSLMAAFVAAHHYAVRVPPHCLLSLGCFYGWREGAGHEFLGPNSATDEWSIKKVTIRRGGRAAVLVRLKAAAPFRPRRPVNAK